VGAAFIATWLIDWARWVQQTQLNAQQNRCDRRPSITSHTPAETPAGQQLLRKTARRWRAHRETTSRYLYMLGNTATPTTSINQAHVGASIVLDPSTGGSLEGAYWRTRREGSPTASGRY
jgi:hypothetical protein